MSAEPTKPSLAANLAEQLAVPPPAPAPASPAITINVAAGGTVHLVVTAEPKPAPERG